MTKDETWRQLTRRNPKFTTDGANFTAKGLRKFFDVVWDCASMPETKDETVETLRRMFGWK